MLSLDLLGIELGVGLKIERTKVALGSGLSWVLWSAQMTHEIVGHLGQTVQGSQANLRSQ